MGGLRTPTQPPRPLLTAIATAPQDVVAAPPAPRYRTTFVGRESELAEVGRHLADPEVRIVTIVGRSGVGKTRLAVEAGRSAEAAVLGPVAIVELGHTDDVGQVAGLVATAIGAEAVPGQVPEEALRRRLRHAPAVLIVDDLDHVAGAAELLVDLTSQSVRSVIVATAHRPTGLAGERVIRLDALVVPVAGEADAGRLMANPAVVLYADRAAAVDAGFVLTAGNVGDVAELVRRLDGLPLAIELGAARARILTPKAQIAALDEHTALELTEGPTGRRKAEHHDVRAAVATSYAATSPAAQLVLRRLSVAADAVTIARARDIVIEPGWTLADVLDALGELVDLGLADVDQRPDGEPRFRLHPTVAAYGRERLDADDDAAAIERRYDASVCAIARAVRSASHRRRLDALAEASNELHAVFARLVAAGRAEEALELATDLGPLWAQRGLFQGPGSAFESVLETAESRRAEPAPPPTTLARAELWWSRLVVHGANPAEHRAALVTRLARAAAVARSADDRPLLLFALDCTAFGVFVTGDLPGAIAATAEGLALAREIGDREAQRRFEFGSAAVANVTGDMAGAARFAASALEDGLRAQDLIAVIRACSVLWTLPPGTPGVPASVPSAAALLQACLDEGEVAEAMILHSTLTAQAVAAGSVVDAARWALRGLDLAQQFGAWYGAGMTTAALVLLAHAMQDDAAVASLHGSLAPVFAEVSVSMGPYARVYMPAIAGSRERLGQEPFDRLVGDASILDRDAAVERAAAYAQSVIERAGAGPAVHAAPDHDRTTALVLPSRAETPARPEHLTPRELDILRALMTGATNAEIARSLGLRPKTVMHHSVSIYSKLGVRGRTEATAWAYRQGLGGDSPADGAALAAS